MRESTSVSVMAAATVVAAATSVRSRSSSECGSSFRLWLSRHADFPAVGAKNSQPDSHFIYHLMYFYYMFFFCFFFLISKSCILSKVGGASPVAGSRSGSVTAQSSTDGQTAPPGPLVTEDRILILFFFFPEIDGTLRTLILCGVPLFIYFCCLSSSPSVSCQRIAPLCCCHRRCRLNN